MNTGVTWVEFDRRLGPEWADLATALDLPAHVSNRFERGHEAAGIRAWLERTGNLAALGDALSAIGRDELVPLVRDAVASAEQVRIDPTTDLLPSGPAGPLVTLDGTGVYPPASSRRRVVLVLAALCLLLLTTVTVVAWYRGGPTGAPPRTAPSSESAPAPAPTSSESSDVVGVGAPQDPLGTSAPDRTGRGGAVLSASRTAYLGTCPPPGDAIRFTAKLDLGGATGLVQYRWVRSDGLTSDGTVRADSPTARPEVSTNWLPTKNFSGSLRLEILTPVAARSNEVAFSVTCQIAISADLSITPRTVNDCAAVFTVNGVIEVSDGPIEVTYEYEQNSNPQGPPATISFLARGRQTQTIASQIQPLKNGTFTMYVAVQSPRYIRSNEVTYTVTGCP